MQQVLEKGGGAGGKRTSLLEVSSPGVERATQVPLLPSEENEEGCHAQASQGYHKPDKARVCNALLITDWAPACEASSQSIELRRPLPTHSACRATPASQQTLGPHTA